MQPGSVFTPCVVCRAAKWRCNVSAVTEAYGDIGKPNVYGITAV